jgi:hypothetical protein
VTLRPEHERRLGILPALQLAQGPSFIAGANASASDGLVRQLAEATALDLGSGRT